MRKHTKSLVRLIKEHTNPLQEMAGAEVGVWRGHNSFHLLSQFPNLTLAMVDPYEHGGSHETLNEADRAPRILRKAQEEARQMTQEHHERRAILIEDSLTASAGFKDEILDFVFIDAEHLYETVKQDLWAWWPKVKQGGIFAGHDYNSRMDRKGVWGVKKAVDEFAELHGLEVGTRNGNVWWVIKPVEEEATE